MGNLFKSIQDTLAAAAFAEAGEHETAREFLAQGKNAHKKILLGTDNKNLTPKAINYAMNVCSRLGAGLEVVQIFPFARKKSPHMSEDEIKKTFAQKGILYESIIGKAGLGEEIMRYVVNRRDILLLILSVGEKDEGLKKPDNDFLKKFHFPVVFLEDRVPA
jgi:hypothetical protein